MTDRDIILREIANTLYVNLQYVETDALLDGKMGIAIFFYHYARHTGIKKYNEFPDNLLDSVYEKIDRGSAQDFNSGLSGIGWAIDHFIKNGFVETDGETDILAKADDFIDAMTVEDGIKEIEMPVPLFSKGLYFIARDKTYFTSRALGDFMEVIEKNNTHIKLGYINSALYFLLKCIERNIGNDQCVGLLKKLSPLLRRTLDEKLYEKGDLPYLHGYILKILEIEEVSCEYELFDSIPDDNGLPDIADRINYLYDTVPDPAYDLRQVRDFIRENIMSLNSEKLTVLKGLAGMGLNILLTKQYDGLC